MPRKERIPGLTRDAKTGGWKYQKRVPADIVDLVGKPSWGERLGTDYAAAVGEALRLEAENKATIARLRNPEIAEAELTAGVVQAAAVMVETRKDVTDLTESYHWRNAAQQMQSRAHCPPDEQAEYLGVLLAVAFGDAAHVQAFPPADLHNAAILKRLGTGKPPKDATDLIMFDALKEAVTKRLKALPVNRHAKLTHLGGL